MKNLCMAIALAGSVAAQAAPFLTKRVTNGSVAPPYQTTTTCHVSEKEVSVEVTAGVVGSTSKSAIALKGNIKALIDAAATGKITTGQPVIGGGITTYEAAQVDARGRSKTVILKVDDGGDGTQNDAEEAATLVNLLDGICK